MKFSLEPLLRADPVIIWHTVLAFLALFLGALIWRLKKGTTAHKYAGRIFVALMLGVAVTAIFIREINAPHMSLIHIFVPITFLGAAQAIYYIRKGNMRGHKKAVQGLYFGALIIPGLFTLLPGRTIWAVFFAG